MQTLKIKLVKPYIALVSLLGLGVISFLAVRSHDLPAWLDLVFFALVSFGVANYTFLLTKVGISVSFNLPLLFIMTMNIGPFWATILITMAAISLSTFRDFRLKEFVFNRSMVAVISGVSSLYLSSTTVSGFFPIMLDFIIAGLIYCLLNIGLLSTIIYLFSENGLTSRDYVYLLELARGAAISVVLSFLLYQIYASYGEICLLISFALIVMLKNLLLTYYNQHDNFFQLINSFMKVIDAKDHYTKGHCDRTAQYTEDLAKAYGFSRYRIAKLVQVARLHDVGKIWIPENILNKPGRLTRDEFEQIKDHAVKGMELMEEIEVFKNYLPIIRHHHEKYDGTGYPDGLKGENIPLEARLLALADAFDVMTHGRVYKSPMQKEQVIAELQRCSGSQFDPKIASILLKLLSGGKYDYLFAQQEQIAQMNLQAYGE